MNKVNIKKEALGKYFLLASAVLVFCLLIWSCSQDKNPLPSKSHTEEWSNLQSENFHGAKVVTVGAGSCKSCHGADYYGGESDISCYDCHPSFPHPKEWMAKSSAHFHGNDIRQNGWSMNGCKSCHGSDYRGGTTGASCFKCHTSEAGPEGCNVCHGNSEHIHPPEDLNNNTAETAMGVGAHEKHLKIFQCSICHVVPASFSDPSHIDAAPAEVHAQWSWDRTTGTCATSCHGGKLIWNNFDH